MASSRVWTVGLIWPDGSSRLENSYNFDKTYIPGKTGLVGFERIIHGRAGCDGPIELATPRKKFADKRIICPYCGKEIVFDKNGYVQVTPVQQLRRQ